MCEELVYLGWYTSFIYILKKKVTFILFLKKGARSFRIVVAVMRML